jgi:hypothetical protein
MNHMKKIIAVIVALTILAAGIYTGVWLMLIGGIVDIIGQIKAPETNPGVLAGGIAKAVFFEVPIAVSFWIDMLLIYAAFIRKRRSFQMPKIHSFYDR